MGTLNPMFIERVIRARLPAATQGGAPPVPRIGSLRLHDTNLGVWEETVNQEDMQRNVFGPIIRLLKDKGWKIGDDPKIKKHYPSLNGTHRLGRKGDLEIKISLSGRHVEIILFQNVANVENRNGGEYDLNKLKKMPYLLRLQTIATIAALCSFLTGRHGYGFQTSHEPRVRFGELTAYEYVESQYAKDKRTPAHLRDDWDKQDYNRKSSDGQIISQGQTVWLKPKYPAAGRYWIKGQAFHNINNMWMVIAGNFSLFSCSSYELRVSAPDDIRMADPSVRRKSLELKLTKAWAAGRFEQATTLRKILFGDQPLFRIWSDDKNAWYCCQGYGYTLSPERIGLFTREEAEHQKGDIKYLKIVAV